MHQSKFVAPAILLNSEIEYEKVNRNYNQQLENYKTKVAQGEKDIALTNYIGTLRNYWVAYYRLRKITLFDFEANDKLIVLPTKN